MKTLNNLRCPNISTSPTEADITRAWSLFIVWHLKKQHLTALAFALGFAFACGAQKESNDSKTSSGDDNQAKRPSEDPDDPPGYLSDPENVAVKIDRDNNLVTLDAPSSTLVFSQGGIPENTFINVWQAKTVDYEASITKPDANKNLLLAAVHKISINPNADGSFKLEFQNTLFIAEGSLGTMVLSITSSKQDDAYAVSQLHSDGTSAFIRNLDVDESSKAIKNYKFVLPKDYSGPRIADVGPDKTAPSAPANFQLAKSWSSLDSSPTLSWNAPSENDVSHYELSILVSGSATFVLSNLNIGKVSSYQASGLVLSNGEKYSVSLSVVDKSGNKASVQSSFENLVCPAGYVKVVGNKTSKLGGAAYNTGTKDSRKIADFCVMKYEGKIFGNDNGQAGNPNSDSVESRAEGSPWVSLSRDQAKSRCEAQGAGYSLVNNAQWQAIARDIEGVNSNWAQGVSEGDLNNALNRGHSDDNNSSSGSLAANVDDSQGCYMIGAETYDANSVTSNCGGTWHVNKRTNTLSNGSVIWDFGGNVSEWLKDDISSAQGSDGFIQAELWNDGLTGKLEWGAVGDHTSKTGSDKGGLGHGELNASAGALVRGGKFNGGNIGGVFAVSLGASATSSNTSTGFRCSFAP